MSELTINVFGHEIVFWLLNVSNLLFIVHNWYDFDLVTADLQILDSRNFLQEDVIPTEITLYSVVRS